MGSVKLSFRSAKVNGKLGACKHAGGLFSLFDWEVATWPSQGCWPPFSLKFWVFFENGFFGLRSTPEPKITKFNEEKVNKEMATKSLVYCFFLPLMKENLSARASVMHVLVRGVVIIEEVLRRLSKTHSKQQLHHGTA